jgi:hypothetical protein
MKRFVTVCTLALAILAASEQKASAWKKFGFNVGLNIAAESADNNLLWGAFRDGPVPGAHTHGLASTITKHHAGHVAPIHGGGFGGGFDPHFAPMPAPVHGVPGHGVPAPLPGPAPAPMPQATRPAPTTVQAAYWVPAETYYWPGN